MSRKESPKDEALEKTPRASSHDKFTRAVRGVKGLR